jgi:hypothetical protein
MKTTTKFIVIMILGAFATACGGGVSTEKEVESAEISAVDLSTESATDSVVVEIEQGVQEVSEAAEEVEASVDELLMDI